MKTDRFVGLLFFPGRWSTRYVVPFSSYLMDIDFDACKKWDFNAYGYRLSVPSSRCEYDKERKEGGNSAILILQETQYLHRKPDASDAPKPARFADRRAMSLIGSEIDKSGCNVWEAVSARYRRLDAIRAERKAKAAAALDVSAWLHDMTNRVASCRTATASSVHLMILSDDGSSVDSFDNPPIKMIKDFQKLVYEFNRFVQYKKENKFRTVDEIQNAMKYIDSLFEKVLTGAA